MKTLILMMAALCAIPQLSFSAVTETRRYYRYSEHPQLGVRTAYLPTDTISVQVGERRYFYYDGLYYDQVGPDYVVVAPPLGAIVRTLPKDFQPVTINGVKYYTHNGIYYQTVGSGYKVVQKPAASTTVVQTVTTNSPNVTTVVVPTEEFTVNVPNTEGGYTPVAIKKSGSGYLGPQGEFYAEFPPVSQLRVMYGAPQNH